MEIFTVRRGTGVGGQRFASASRKVSADQIWSGVYYMPWLRYYIVNTVDITGHPALLRKVLIPGKYFVLIRQKSLTIMTRHACSSSELFSKAWVWVPEPAKCFFIFFFRIFKAWTQARLSKPIPHRSALAHRLKNGSLCWRL